MTDWQGHPWGYSVDHRPVGHGQAICAGCDERCSEQVGCMCCCEQAHEWLLAEARWCAEEWRADAWDYCRQPLDGVQDPVPGEDVLPFPWETP